MKIMSQKKQAMKKKQIIVGIQIIKKIEAKIKVMNLQMITGGQKLEETPQFKNALQEKQVMLEKDFEQKLMEIEREREQIEEKNLKALVLKKLIIYYYYMKMNHSKEKLYY